MATLKEAERLTDAERRNKQAAQMLRVGMGSYVIDIASVLAVLEGDSDRCSPEAGK